MKTSQFHRDEWRVLASLANSFGYEAGWKSSEEHPGRQVAQETIRRRAQEAMQRSRLVGHLVEQPETLDCWVRNYYRGWRCAEIGSPQGTIYPGYGLYQALAQQTEEDDYQPTTYSLSVRHSTSEGV